MPDTIIDLQTLKKFPLVKIDAQFFPVVVIERLIDVTDKRRKLVVKSKEDIKMGRDYTYVMTDSFSDTLPEDIL